ncbi:MAG: histidine ammonia-lyase, partial [Bacteriovoracaceae bacterium]
CNTQGLEFLRPLKTSPALERVHALVRKHVQKIVQDRTFHKDIENICRIIQGDELIKEVEAVTGPLA